MSPDTYSKLIVIFRDASDRIKELLPPGREAALAQTKLDEARLWAKEAVYRAITAHDNG